MPDQTKSFGNNQVPGFFYGTAWKEERTQGLIEEALRQGFRAIDTANQRKHYDEAAVGLGVAAAINAEALTREELFLQSKFTFPRGQDHRLPYDPKAPLPDQVVQSFKSSLQHLQTDYLDSYLLHGPSSRDGLKDVDWAVWRAMEDIQVSGGVRFLGISNISLDQLKALCEGAEVPPYFVQNRCYASKRWDKEIRAFCAANNILYQGFSLLTANRTVLNHPTLLNIGKTHGMSIIQTVFRFAIDVGMISLTGTTNANHMSHDLLAFDFKLTEAEVAAIESAAV